MRPLLTSPGIWAAGQEPVSPENIKLRQCKLGELCWLDTAPRPGSCARLAWIAARVAPLQGSAVYRLNDLARAVQSWQQAGALKFASSRHHGAQARGDIHGRVRIRGEKIRCRTGALAEWPDAAYGDRLSEGRCERGRVIGLRSSPLSGPYRILQWAAKFTRKLVESSLRGEVYAFSEMVDTCLSFERLPPLPCGLTARHDWSRRLRKPSRGGTCPDASWGLESCWETGNWPARPGRRAKKIRQMG